MADIRIVRALCGDIASDMSECDAGSVQVIELLKAEQRDTAALLDELSGLAGSAGAIDSSRISNSGWQRQLTLTRATIAVTCGVGAQTERAAPAAHDTIMLEHAPSI